MTKLSDEIQILRKEKTQSIPEINKTPVCNLPYV